MSRSVLVTGGNRGIGLAIVEAFRAAGDHVAATYRTDDPPKVDDVFWVRADVTDPESLDTAFETIEAEHGPVEVVVANAGITRDTLVLRMRDEDFAAVLDSSAWPARWHVSWARGTSPRTSLPPVSSRLR